MATVYLIHFDRALKQARHYLGYVAPDSLSERIDRHKAGNGARLLAECNRQGIGYHVVQSWVFKTAIAARDFERKMKRRKNSPRYCPVCNRSKQVVSKD